MRQWIIRGIGLAACLAVLLVGLWWFAPAGRINQDSFARIETGMSREEVHQLLGVPPGDYLCFEKRPTLTSMYAHFGRGADDLRWGKNRESWETDGIVIDVYWDSSGQKVIGKALYLYPAPPPRNMLEFLQRKISYFF
jgi:hypothetical protein